MARWKEGRAYFRRNQLFPQLERHRDVTRGEARLASEAALAMLAGDPLPAMVIRRAIIIAEAMARQ